MTDDLDPPRKPVPGELTFTSPRRRKPPRHLADLTAVQRREAVTEHGLPAFRADQVSRHYFTRFADDPASWSDVPAALRDDLAAVLTPPIMTVVRERTADKGMTRKTLWRLFDGALVESVLMRYPGRVTMCVAGARELARGEVAGGVGRVSNVVFMGMGEPLANYDTVVSALHRMTDKSPEGLGMSARGITVSTVGLVPRMRQLATEGMPVTLALSLHAPDDELRDTLVPVNTRWKIAEVLDAAWDYARTTKRRVSIEYALIKDINDQAWRADLLAKRLRGKLVHVNLIPLNPTPGSKWTASSREDEREFVRRLEAGGVAVTVRDTRGRDIDGACGQLAAAE